MKLLSIIVPSYNMEHYLPKCLGSLIVDDPALLQELDVIVVNDGSKDRTSEIAHEFEAKYPGVFRVIDKPNGNYGSCINAALPVAHGKYVKVLDADDTFETEAFSKFISEVSSLSEDVDLIVSDFVEVDVNGNDMEFHRFRFPKGRACVVDDFLEPDSCPILMHAIAYRKSLLDEIGYVQTEGISYTDMEWDAEPMAAVKKAYYCDCGVLYRYLVGRQGQTTDPAVAVRSMSVCILVLKSILRRLGDCERDMGVARRRAFMIAIKSSISIYSYLMNSRQDGLGDDARSFDRELLAAYPNFYAELNGVAYSRRFPYHYIRGWRRGFVLHRFMLRLCKVYSWMAMRLPRLKVD